MKRGPTYGRQSHMNPDSPRHAERSPCSRGDAEGVISMQAGANDRCRGARRAPAVPLLGHPV